MLLRTRSQPLTPVVHRPDSSQGNADSENAGMEPKRRILIADALPLMRDALRDLINRQPDTVSCGEFGSPAMVRSAVADVNPNLVLMDMHWNNGDGLDLIKWLKAEWKNLPILVFSQGDEGVYAERALRAGALGYLSKDHPADEVLTAVRAVLSGEMFMSRKVAALLFHKTLEQPTQPPASRSSLIDVMKLSDRELQVFQLLGAGKPTKDIASDLHLSIKTVETHRENIKHKLDIRDAVGLMRQARQWLESNVIMPSCTEVVAASSSDSGLPPCASGNSITAEQDAQTVGRASHQASRGR